MGFNLIPVQKPISYSKSSHFFICISCRLFARVSTEVPRWERNQEAIGKAQRSTYFLVTAVDKM
jgi:hypothetical protein